MPTSLFDRVAGLCDEIGAEKTAAAAEKRAETGIPDPGGAEGATSHPSKKTDDDLQPASEGEQSADNTRIVKETVPDSVDSKSDETHEGAPKATDVQLGSETAKPTGDDPSAEGDYKAKLEGDKRQGDQGGTSHPATGSYGEKYSADAVTSMSDEALLKSACDLGNELTSDLANGLLSPTAKNFNGAGRTPTTKQAAAAGQRTAAQAGAMGNQLEKVASGVVQQVVKEAYGQADLVTDHLARELAILKKQAHEEETEGEDPTGGAGEGEDHGTEEAGGPPVAGGGEELPPEAAESLLAAMGGGEMGGGGGLDGGLGGDPGMGGMGGPEMGGELGGAPPEMGGMGDQDALQQLAMALMEAGIDPQQLAALAGGDGQKIASAVYNYKRAGHFAFSEAKQGSDQRKVRDYMKGFVLELYNRSRK